VITPFRTFQVLTKKHVREVYIPVNVEKSEIVDAIDSQRIPDKNDIAIANVLLAMGYDVSYSWFRNSKGVSITTLIYGSVTHRIFTRTDSTEYASGCVFRTDSTEYASGFWPFHVSHATYPEDVGRVLHACLLNPECSLYTPIADKILACYGVKSANRINNASINVIHTSWGPVSIDVEKKTLIFLQNIGGYAFFTQAIFSAYTVRQLSEPEYEKYLQGLAAVINSQILGGERVVKPNIEMREIAKICGLGDEKCFKHPFVVYLEEHPNYVVYAKNGYLARALKREARLSRVVSRIACSADAFDRGNAEIVIVMEKGIEYLDAYHPLLRDLVNVGATNDDEVKVTGVSADYKACGVTECSVTECSVAECSVTECSVAECSVAECSVAESSVVESVGKNTPVSDATPAKPSAVNDDDRFIISDHVHDVTISGCPQRVIADTYGAGIVIMYGVDNITVSGAGTNFIPDGATTTALTSDAVNTAAKTCNVDGGGVKTCDAVKTSDTAAKTCNVDSAAVETSNTGDGITENTAGPIDNTAGIIAQIKNTVPITVNFTSSKPDVKYTTITIYADIIDNPHATSSHYTVGADSFDAIKLLARIVSHRGVESLLNEPYDLVDGMLRHALELKLDCVFNRVEIQVYFTDTNGTEWISWVGPIFMKYHPDFISKYINSEGKHLITSPRVAATFTALFTSEKVIVHCDDDELLDILDFYNLQSLIPNVIRHDDELEFKLGAIKYMCCEDRSDEAIKIIKKTNWDEANQDQKNFLKKLIAQATGIDCIADL